MDIAQEIFLILQMIFFAIVVSLDNAILIGLITKGIEQEKKKKVALLGSLLGVLLRLILSFLFYFLLTQDIPVIYMLGGGFVAVAGLLTMGGSKEKEKEDKKSISVLRIVLSIFLVDAMLSFDNSIAIAEQTKDLINVIGSTDNRILISSLIIVFTTLISFPIIFFGATAFSSILEESEALVYLSSFLLISIGIGMFMEDPVFNGTFTSLSIYIRMLIQYGGSLSLMGTYLGISHLLLATKK